MSKVGGSDITFAWASNYSVGAAMMKCLIVPYDSEYLHIFPHVAPFLTWDKPSVEVIYKR